MKWLGFLRQYIDLLEAGRSGDRILLGARYFAPVQTGSGAHPASYTMDDVSFLGVNWLGRVVDNPHPLALRLMRE